MKNLITISSISLLAFSVLSGCGIAGKSQAEWDEILTQKTTTVWRPYVLIRKERQNKARFERDFDGEYVLLSSGVVKVNTSSLELEEEVLCDIASGEEDQVYEFSNNNIGLFFGRFNYDADSVFGVMSIRDCIAVKTADWWQKDPIQSNGANGNEDLFTWKGPKYTKMITGMSSKGKNYMMRKIQTSKYWKGS